MKSVLKLWVGYINLNPWFVKINVRVDYLDGWWAVQPLEQACRHPKKENNISLIQWKIFKLYSIVNVGFIHTVSNYYILILIMYKFSYFDSRPLDNDIQKPIYSTSR